jgi:hypothetical protein
MTAVSRPRYGGAAKFSTSTPVARQHQPEHQQVAAIVVGGGAAGIAVLGNLLEKIDHGKIAWVDPKFQGGRINRKYREVPSNTKAGLFLCYAEAVKPFQEILKTTSKPNAASALEELPQDDTCPLGYAGDMLQMLSDGLVKHDRVEVWQGKVTEASRNEGVRDVSSLHLLRHNTNKYHIKTSEWTLKIQNEVSKTVESRTTPLVVYCTGASPTTVALPSSPALLDLDIALKPSELTQFIPKQKATTIGVVGASHSAILVLMNLFKLSQTSHPHLRVRWFARSPTLKYAIYKEGWILYDNTGLKGAAAQFAREQLDGEKLQGSEAGKLISRVDCSGGPEHEKLAMARELPECDYVVQAVGFTNDQLPAMKQDIAFDHETGGFVDPKTEKAVTGLFGAGIAFPAKVVDPAGNVEYAVGFFKFMKFLKKAVPEWVEKTY